MLKWQQQPGSFISRGFWTTSDNFICLHGHRNMSEHSLPGTCSDMITFLPLQDGIPLFQDGMLCAHLTVSFGHKELPHSTYHIMSLSATKSVIPGYGTEVELRHNLAKHTDVLMTFIPRRSQQERSCCSKLCLGKQRRSWVFSL
ncbi:uncharacterized protein LOC118150187 [Callithrix jacchus]